MSEKCAKIRGGGVRNLFLGCFSTNAKPSPHITSMCGFALGMKDCIIVKKNHEKFTLIFLVFRDCFCRKTLIMKLL